MCPSYQIIFNYPVRADINMCRRRDLLRWRQGNIRMEWLMRFTDVFVILELTSHHRIEILLYVTNPDHAVMCQGLCMFVLLREYDQVYL